jgi:hypothetical protein
LISLSNRDLTLLCDEMSFMFHKIFNIGLPKTGTTSLNQALLELGFTSIHNPKAFRKQALEGRYHFDRDDWQALTNFGEHFYPQLDQVYPHSKFILTVRDETTWLNSWQKQIGDTSGDESRTRWVWTQPLKKWLRLLQAILDNDLHMSHQLSRIDIFGAYKFNADRCLYVYRLHRQNAEEYFKDRPQDFLIMDICAGDGWEKLCPFLEISEITNVPFPFKRPEKAPFA